MTSKTNTSTQLASAVVAVAATAVFLSSSACAQGSDAQELAKQLSNPVASLISVPFQFNYDREFGPQREGHKYTLNIQPVIPISISEDWNLISRTIMPIISQKDVVPGTGSQSGLGDITQSLFFSPKKPTAGGWIWGAGPVFLIPTATNDLLGADRWGIGPTAVVLRQEGHWTYGVLANHIWSVGGSSRADISSTFVQPFVAYATPDAWTFTLQTETTYDWENEQWTVPINALVAKLVKFGSQPVQFFGGVRYWADSPASGPHGWGLRFGVTLLFPK